MFAPIRIAAVVLGSLTCAGIVRAGGEAVSVASPPPGLERELSALVERGGVAWSQDGQVRWVYGDGVYVPASVLKMATGLAALELLGPDYRFHTDVYRDGVGNLYLKGFGDPNLVSEEWRAIAEELRGAGAFDGQVADIVADESAVVSWIEVDGRGDSLNPYDARPGGLVSNFNTVQVTVGRNGRIEPGEPQTPLTALARELARGLPAGVQRINLSRRSGTAARYSAELAMAIFRESGARISGRARGGNVPPGATLLWVHRSRHTVRDVVRGMLEFSNNVVANQLLLTLALEQLGPPASLEQGVAILRDFLTQRLGLAPREVLLVEGSGLSRSNRIGLLAMLRVVDAFYPWRELLQPHAGVELPVLAKTGTLAGVSSLAGFLPAPEGSRRAFAILLNQSRNTRDDVLRALLRGIEDGSIAATAENPSPADIGAY